MAKKSSASSQPEPLKSMKSKDIKSRVWTEAERKAMRRIADRQAKGEQVTASPEIPPLTREQLASMVSLRESRRRVAVSLRLDPRVLEWLKSKGAGHLTRINDILTNLMEAEQRTRPGR